MNKNQLTEGKASAIVDTNNTTNSFIDSTVSSGANNIDNQFIIDGFYNLLGMFMNKFGSYFTPIHVSGFLDDLIGQQLAIFFILLILTLSLILLLISFFISNIIFINKDYIIKRFNNKFILLYIKYHSFMFKITLIYIPILMFIGLFVLIHGLHYLITHPIPYDQLGIDLHTYVDYNKK